MTASVSILMLVSGGSSDETLKLSMISFSDQSLIFFFRPLLSLILAGDPSFGDVDFPPVVFTLSK